MEVGDDAAVGKEALKQKSWNGEARVLHKGCILSGSERCIRNTGALECRHPAAVTQ